MDDTLDPMRRGPTSGWRPRDLIAVAVHVARMATREIEEMQKLPGCLLGKALVSRAEGRVHLP